jgi:hypothetical protein
VKSFQTTEANSVKYSKTDDTWNWDIKNGPWAGPVSSKSCPNDKLFNRKAGIQIVKRAGSEI